MENSISQKALTTTVLESHVDPIYNVPSTNTEYIQKFPEYGYPNIWPKELPHLETHFMHVYTLLTKLGKLIVDVGKLVASQCDAYLSKSNPNSPKLADAIESSINAKARLLHYFPISDHDVDDADNFDSWCGLHVDHSMLTGLTCPMYIDETDRFGQVDLTIPDLKKAIDNAGLYIKDKKGSFVKAIVH